MFTKKKTRELRIAISDQTHNDADDRIAISTTTTITRAQPVHTSPNARWCCERQAQGRVVWHMPFSHDIQPRLVNVDNPKRGHPQYRARVRGKYHASRMWCPMFYVRERTMLSRTGNTERLSWQHKGSTTTSKIRAAAKSPKNGERTLLVVFIVGGGGWKKIP